MTDAFDWAFILRVLPRFAIATLTTLEVFFTAQIIATAGAMMLALLGRAGSAPVRGALAVFSWLFRGLPELIVLLFAYLALPRLGVPMPPFWAAVAGLAAIGMAYDYEVFRGGLSAVPHGQFEAARALGLRRVPLYWRVVLPQVLRVVITPYITFACGALKRTSVASAVAVPEIMGLSRRFNDAFQRPFELMLIAMVLYALMSSALMILESSMDRWLQRGAIEP
jgi:polar amino acid transport system permease protein